MSHPESTSPKTEVFHESFENFCFDGLSKSCYVVQRFEDAVPTLSRAKLSLLYGGVEWKPVGLVHARARRIGDGMVAIDVIGRNVRECSFEIEESKIKANGRAFWRRFSNAGGALAIVHVGEKSAFCRYLLQQLETADVERGLKNDGRNRDGVFWRGVGLLSGDNPMLPVL